MAQIDIDFEKTANGRWGFTVTGSSGLVVYQSRRGQYKSNESALKMARQYGRALLLGQQHQEVIDHDRSRTA